MYQKLILYVYLADVPDINMFDVAGKQVASHLLDKTPSAILGCRSPSCACFMPCFIDVAVASSFSSSF